MSNRIVTSKCVGIIHLLRVVLLLFYKAEKVVNEIDLVVVITQVFIQTTIRFGNCVELWSHIGACVENDVSANHTIRI
jgi:hypothetical protein